MTGRGERVAPNRQGARGPGQGDTHPQPVRSVLSMVASTGRLWVVGEFGVEASRGGRRDDGVEGRPARWWWSGEHVARDLALVVGG